MSVDGTPNVDGTITNVDCTDGPMADGVDGEVPVCRGTSLDGPTNVDGPITKIDGT